MFFDTHTHYDDDKFDLDRYEVIERAHAEGVDLIVAVGANMESSLAAIKLAEKYDFIYAAVGVHPSDAGDMTDKDLDTLRSWAKHDKVKAIGEIGLDYYYDSCPREVQKYWFEKQIELAKEVGLPIVVHDRDAHGDCLEILKKADVSVCGGVMHCYSGSSEMARQLLELGMYISFTGSITFKNAAKLPEVVANVPLERIFIETDCPYLAPVPYRGKRNDSGYVHLVAEKIAEIKNITLEQVAEATKENAVKFFGI